MQSMILCGLVKNGTFGFYKTGRIRVRDVSGCFCFMLQVQILLCDYVSRYFSRLDV